MADLRDEVILDGNYPAVVLRSLVANLQLLIEEIWQSPRRLEEVARSSYHHANSFEKIVLGSSPGGRKLVWHYWPQAETPDAEIEIHNHRWKFASLVLAGRLEAHTYQVADDGDIERRHCYYESPGSSQNYDLEWDSDVRLRLIRTEIFERDMSYFQPREEIHSAIATLPGTATVIVQDSEARISCDVYTQISNTADQRVVEGLSVSELRGRLRVLEHLVRG